MVQQMIETWRFAVRRIARAPLATATMIGIFGIGIGFSAALFLFVRAFVGGPVPGVPAEDSLVRIRGIDRTAPGRAIGREFPSAEYRQYAAQTSLFSAVAAWTSSDAVLDVGARETNLQSGAATFVTANYFQVLGIRPVLGTGLPVDLKDADAAPPMVAVISDALWARHFDRSADVIGRAMKVNGVAVTIVGVAPRRFAGARTGGSQMRVWLPLATRPEVQRLASAAGTDADLRLGLVARLQAGVRAEDASDVVAAMAKAQHAEDPTGLIASADVVPMLGSNYFPPPGGPEEPSAGRWVALLFPLLVLLITCTNVSALQAGLGVARRREIAVRLALGAGRWRVVGHLVGETVLLAIASGVLCLFVIWMLVRVFDASIPDLTIEIDPLSVAFTLGLALAAGVLFGVWPALHATRLSVQDVLKDSAGVAGARRLRLQSWLVVAQIAFTQPALLAMGALLLEIREDLGARPAQPHADRLLELHFNVNPRYGAIDDERERTIGRVQDRLAAIPGVDGVVRQEHLDAFDVEVHSDDAGAGLVQTAPQQVRGVAAPAGYFRLMGLAFERGRDFEAGERDDEGAVVIGSRLARRLWGGEDAVGRRLIAVGRNLRNIATFTVVGVVDDGADEADAGDEARIARLYMPDVHTTGHLLVRTQGPADALLPAIRAAAAEAAPALPIVAARTLAAAEAAERRSTVSAMAAAGGTGALALLLSAIGLYAVVAFAVGQRIREIGLRAALGADRRQIVGLFVRRGLGLSLTGLAVGLAMGLAGARIIAAAEGREPPAGTLGVAAIVAVFVMGVALLASWLSARRAAQVDPLDALRVD